MSSLAAARCWSTREGPHLQLPSVPAAAKPSARAAPTWARRSAAGRSSITAWRAAPQCSPGVQEVDSGGTATSTTILERRDAGRRNNRQRDGERHDPQRRDAERRIGGSGAATSTTIFSGGTQFVENHQRDGDHHHDLGRGAAAYRKLRRGTATNTTISSGGTQIVGNLASGSATATSTTILSGGGSGSEQTSVGRRPTPRSRTAGRSSSE